MAKPKIELKAGEKTSTLSPTISKNKLTFWMSSITAIAIPRVEEISGEIISVWWWQGYRKILRT